MDVSDDITEFVTSKVQSLCAQADEEDIEGRKSMIPRRNNDRLFFEDFETEKFKSAVKKFQNIFNMPNEEKLVICQSIYSH